MVLVWLWPVPATIPPLFGWSRYRLTGMLNTCCFDFVHRDIATRSFILFISTWGFFLPVTVITICYSLITRYVLILVLRKQKHCSVVVQRFKRRREASTGRQLRYSQVSESVLKSNAESPSRLDVQPKEGMRLMVRVNANVL